MYEKATLGYFTRGGSSMDRDFDLVITGVRKWIDVTIVAIWLNFHRVRESDLIAPRVRNSNIDNTASLLLFDRNKSYLMSKRKPPIPHQYLSTRRYVPPKIVAPIPIIPAMKALLLITGITSYTECVVVGFLHHRVHFVSGLIDRGRSVSPSSWHGTRPCRGPQRRRRGRRKSRSWW